jgi:hypothetical protein
MLHEKSFPTGASRERERCSGPQQRHFQRSLLATSRFVGMCGLLLGCSATVWAGEWSLIKGAEQDVCQAYFKYLQAFEAPPFRYCTRPSFETFPELTRPEWEELVPLDHMGVHKETFFKSWKSSHLTEWINSGGYEAALGNLYPETPSVEAFEEEGLRAPSEYDVWQLAKRDVFELFWQEKMEEWFVGRIKNNDEILKRAHFDFDNDGDVDTIYRRGIPNACRATYPETQNAEEAAAKGEPEFQTFWVISAFDEGGDIPKGALYSKADLDTFGFEGKTYLDGWNHHPGVDAAAPFYVYQIEGYQPHPQALMTSVCGFTVSTEQWHR